MSNLIEGEGNGGDVRITAKNLEVINRATLSANTFGSGNAGNVEITANSVEVANGSQLIAVTLGAGDAGHIVIETQGRTVFDGASAAFRSVEAGYRVLGGRRDRFPADRQPDPIWPHLDQAGSGSHQPGAAPASDGIVMRRGGAQQFGQHLCSTVSDGGASAGISSAVEC